ncbi:unnamed protein product [Amoebophrya sp. A25]|nr:unnamed protein product [Amoebophrya sp. A25]|eukprot:GSA25T00018656001.1
MARCGCYSSIPRVVFALHIHLWWTCTWRLLYRCPAVGCVSLLHYVLAAVDVVV